MAIGDFGERPFGLREVVVRQLTGGSHRLQAERVVVWRWLYDAANLEGEDRIVEVGSRLTGYEWEMEEGGISLALYAALVGSTLSATGATDYYLRRDYDHGVNYLRISGRSIAEDGGQIAVILRQCKVTSGPEGRLEKGVFYLTQCSGVGIADDTAHKRFVEIRQASAARALDIYFLRAGFDAPNRSFVNAEVLNSAVEGVRDGQLTVVDVETGKLSITSNHCAITAQGTPDWTELGFKGALLGGGSFTKVLGLGLLAMVNLSTWEEMGLGWHSAAAVVDPDNMKYALQANTTDGQVDVKGGTIVKTGLSLSTDYRFILVCGGYDSGGLPYRTGQTVANFKYGCAMFIRIGTANTLVWRQADDNTAALYAIAAFHDAVGTIDDIRVPDVDLKAVHQPNNLSLFSTAGELDAITPEVGGVWTEDIGDWDAAANVLKATGLGIATFTGLADHMFDVSMKMPAAGQVAGGLVIRVADLTGASEDYWYVKVIPDTAGNDFELIEHVGGDGGTQRAVTDVDFASGSTVAIRVISVDEDIACFADGVDRITYASAATGKTETAVGLRDEGNANMEFDTVVLYPTTSTTYNTTLDAV